MIKKNKLTAFITMVLISAVMTAFAGCSGQSGSGTPFSQTIIGEEPRIWFECQNKIEQSEDETDYIILDADDPEAEGKVFGRETRVIYVKVFKDGKLSSYTCTEGTNYLGHFAKMTDEEILKELENEDLYICGQKDQPYEIYLYSDAAGQEIMFEGVPAIIHDNASLDPIFFMTLISNETIPTFQVYDSYYGGFALYNYDESMLREACMVTRCEKGDSFSIDGMELEGAILDYKTPEEMLHEKNLPLMDQKKQNENGDLDSEEGEGEDGEYANGENPEGEDGTDQANGGY